MTELVRSWVIGLTGMSLITAVVLTLTPKGKVRRVVTLVCGLGMIIVLIGPILDFDYDSFALYTSDSSVDLESFGTNLEEANEKLTRSIIQERTAAYILDKAESIGVSDAQFTVNTRMDEEGTWYPWEVTAEGTFTQSQKLELVSYMTGEIGIPEERQYWSTTDEE